MFMYVLVFLLQYGKYYYGSVVKKINSWREHLFLLKDLTIKFASQKSKYHRHVFILYIFIPTLLGNVLKKNIFWKITNSLLHLY